MDESSFGAAVERGKVDEARAAAGAIPEDARSRGVPTRPWVDALWELRYGNPARAATVFAELRREPEASAAAVDRLALLEAIARRVADPNAPALMRPGYADVALVADLAFGRASPGWSARWAGPEEFARCWHGPLGLATNELRVLFGLTELRTDPSGFSHGLFRAPGPNRSWLYRLVAPVLRDLGVHPVRIRSGNAVAVDLDAGTVSAGAFEVGSVGKAYPPLQLALFLLLLEGEEATPEALAKRHWPTGGPSDPTEAFRAALARLRGSTPFALTFVETERGVRLEEVVDVYVRSARLVGREPPPLGRVLAPRLLSPSDPGADEPTFLVPGDIGGLRWDWSIDQLVEAFPTGSKDRGGYRIPGFVTFPIGPWDAWVALEDGRTSAVVISPRLDGKVKNWAGWVDTLVVALARALGGTVDLEGPEVQEQAVPSGRLAVHVHHKRPRLELSRP